MNRLFLSLYVDFTLCLLFAGARHYHSQHTDYDFAYHLPPSLMKSSYKVTITPSPPDLASATNKSILNTSKDKRMARRKVVGDIFGTPPSLLEIDKSSASIEISKNILNSIFWTKLGTPKNETPTTIAKKPPDSLNSTDTSNLDDRFLTVGLLKFLYHGPENQVNDNPIPENLNDNRQGMISDWRITIGTAVQNEKNSIPESKNAAYLNFISSILIFVYFIVVKVV